MPRVIASFFNPYLLVFLGGAVGSVMRYQAAVLFGARPVTTFAVNIIGSFFIGLLTSVIDDSRTRLLLGTGVLGGFTTFSTWQFEAMRAAQLENGSKAAFLILFGSLIAGFLACWTGHELGQRLKP